MDVLDFPGKAFAYNASVASRKGDMMPRRTGSVTRLDPRAPDPREIGPAVSSWPGTAEAQVGSTPVEKTRSLAYKFFYR